MKFPVKLAMIFFALVAARNALALQPPDGYFEIGYEWNSGSVQPPWHLQYRILIHSDGPSEVVMVPGYPDIYSDGPRWRFKLDPSKEQIDAFIKFSDDNSLYRGLWWIKHDPSLPQPLPPIGGPSCMMWVMRLVKGVAVTGSVPCNDYEIYDSFKENRNLLVKLIKEVVPADVWDQLNASREKYSNEAGKLWNKRPDSK